MADDNNYIIKKKLAILYENEEKTHTKEVNIISWYGRETGIDIRRWSKNHKPGRGITLNTEEAEMLRDVLNEYFR